jgi:hypothetical protein
MFSENKDMDTNISVPWISITKCYNPRCIALLCEKDTDLIPNIVNEILITNNPSYNSKFIIQIDHHLFNNSTWRILNEYLYYNKIEKTIIIPIVTSHFYQLKAGEILCHFRFVPLCQALYHIQGNYYFIISNLNLKIFNVLFKNIFNIYNFYILEIQDEYFMSDSEDDEEKKEKEEKEEEVKEESIDKI